MAQSTEKQEAYDLLILVDATYSMYEYLASLHQSLPKIISISQLTDCFERIGLLAYRDYSEQDRAQDGLLDWSGWFEQQNPGAGVTADALIAMARRLEPIGGGDFPEATKTGLAKAYEVMREDATTIILLYTDAPPHHAMTGDTRDPRSHFNLEKANLSGQKPTNLTRQFYPVHNASFCDWVSAAKALRGDKKAQVFCFLDSSSSAKVTSGYYAYLSAMTHGACFSMTRGKSSNISEVTVDVLLAWMGVEKPGAVSADLPARLSRYISGASIKKLNSDTDLAANGFFWAHGSKTSAEAQIASNMTETAVTTDILKQHLPKKKTLTANFADRYKVDADYRRRTTKQMAQLIESDVTAIALNPVFGSLWRAICNDRENPERDTLLNTFSQKVDKIADADEKTRMKSWLEESYDYLAEINDLISAVPEADLFPCVFLDPTVRHTTAADADGNVRPITDFKRDELLEIGRSCDYRILRRLGNVLTQLTYVESAAELPEHIKTAAIARIPMCLASKKNGFQFYRILLHLILPGTMLGGRAAAVLAALSLKMGIQPMSQAAYTTMFAWRDKWNDLEVPETWNTGCLALLIDADNATKDYADGSVLQAKDRQLFEKLVSYKLAEANLQTILKAEVGRTPDLTQTSVAGALIQCRSCDFPRSVSIMVEKSGRRCGLCVADDYDTPDVKEQYTAREVSKEDNAQTLKTWVECSMQDCRAQYVVYNKQQLRVRPKCYYCRQGKKAPSLECSKCLNRVIWPKEFRDASLDQKTFECFSCAAGGKATAEQETSAQVLIKENGLKWLLQDEHKVLPDPFNKRSLFHTASTIDLDKFSKDIQVLPVREHATRITIKGKLVRNFPDLHAQLKSWIDRRRAEAVPCSLCFSDFHHTKLRPACARHGCDQRICEGCLKSWYGSNRPGHIINPAALHCPFCRRAPAAKTLAGHGMGIHAVGNLKAAVEEQGTWIYAWCTSCSHAKQHMERVCARGPPQELTDFVCEECVSAMIERLRLEEEDAQRQLAEARRLDDAATWRAQQRLRDLARERVLLDSPVKHCPQCDVATQKVDGCDHISCPCKAHWCWRCGKKYSVLSIYAHMNQAHGGYYDDGEVDDDVDD